MDNMESSRSRSDTFLLSVLFLLLAWALLFSFSACSDPQGEADAKPGTGSNRTAALTDKPIEAFRLELLALGFDTATAYPRSPYLKTRSREQERVVLACLALDQPLRALNYTEKIDNWRRGACYAELACHCAEAGEISRVEHYLDLADKIAVDYRSDPDSQAWRVDRIRIAMAKAYYLLGKLDESKRYETGAVDSELGSLQALKAKQVSADSFDEQINLMDDVILTGSLDQVSNALAACAQLFDRFYDDPVRRGQVEDKIKASLKKIPMMKGIEFMTALAGCASDHGDQAKALELVDETRAFMEDSRWLAKHKVPMMAKLAEVCYRVGDREKALEEAGAALALFESERDQITDMFRPEALLPLAEAYHAMGDRPAALKVYKMALEEGVANPGPRVQAEDLIQTCCSMALAGFQPDDSILKQIEETHTRLVGNPW